MLEKKTENRSIRSIGKKAAAILLSLIACVLLLTAVSMIPQSRIQKNSEKSAAYLTQRDEFVPLLNGWVNSIQDNFADAELMGIAYSIDSHHPFASSVKAVYAQGEDESAAIGYYRLVHGEEKANRSYGRYWHGSMVCIRPLLMFLDLAGIRIAVGSMILLLQLLVLLRLWQTGAKAGMVCYLLAFLLIEPWMLLTCLEYSAVFLVLSVVTLCMLRMIRKGREEEAGVLFAVSGVATCFVDFLTTETLTFTIPMLILLLHLIKTGRVQTAGEGIRRIVFGGIGWAAGYVSAFAAKLLLVLMVCGKAELIASLQAGAVRVGGQVNQGNTNLSAEATTMQRLAGSIWHNLSPLFFVKYDHMTMAGALLPALIVLAVAISVIYLFRRDFPIQKILPVMVLALLPYLRFLVLSNHAYLHFFFTYRAQMVTLMVLFYLVWTYGIRLVPETLGKKPQKNAAKHTEKHTEKRREQQKKKSKKKQGKKR